MRFDSSYPLNTCILVVIIVLHNPDKLLKEITAEFENVKYWSSGSAGEFPGATGEFPGGTGKLRGGTGEFSEGTGEFPECAREFPWDAWLVGDYTRAHPLAGREFPGEVHEFAGDIHEFPGASPKFLWASHWVSGADPRFSGTTPRFSGTAPWLSGASAAAGLSGTHSFSGPSAAQSFCPRRCLWPSRNEGFRIAGWGHGRPSRPSPNPGRYAPSSSTGCAGARPG